MKLYETLQSFTQHYTTLHNSKTLQSFTNFAWHYTILQNFGKLDKVMKLYTTLQNSKPLQSFTQLYTATNLYKASQTLHDITLYYETISETFQNFTTLWNFTKLCENCPILFKQPRAASSWRSRSGKCLDRSCNRYLHKYRDNPIKYKNVETSQLLWPWRGCRFNFHTQRSVEFTHNGAKNNKPPVSVSIHTPLKPHRGLTSKIYHKNTIPVHCKVKST